MQSFVSIRVLKNAAAIALLLAVSVSHAKNNWITDSAEAHKIAKDQGKPLMVDLWAEWCIPCKKLANETFTDPQVVPLLDGFVLAKLDLTDFENPLWQTYEASNLPVVAFFQSDGTRLREFDLTTFEDGAAFAKRLTDVRKKTGLDSGSPKVTTTTTTPKKTNSKIDDGTTAREAGHARHPSLKNIPGSAQASRPRIHASLIASHTTARAGGKMDVAIHLSMHPHWHTYWKYLGVGTPTAVEWSGSQDVIFEENRWTAPLPFADNAQFGYDGEQVITSAIQIPADAKGTLDINANVSWLVCEAKGGCIPGKASLTTTISLGDTAVESPQKSVIHHAKHAYVASTSEGKSTLCDAGIGTDSCPVSVALPLGVAGRESTPIFIPLAHPSLEVKEVSLEKSDDQWTGSFTIKATDTPLVSPWEVGGVFHFQSQSDDESPLAFQVTATVEPALSQAPSQVDPTREEEVTGLWSLILLAFLGGLILNIMPCVLPILSIKALGLVQQADDSKERIWHHGLMYGVGVLASFWVLAGLVIFLKSSGESANWGFQLQSPIFVISMLVMLFAFALSLFGVFEFTLGQQAAGKASNQKGLTGSFLNGIFATMLGTPCTAPMLAPAAGFALSQPAHMVVIFFTAAGIGFAFPFLAIARFPAWSRWIPKPGPWMEHFKKAMAFLLIAAAIWLLDVLTGLTSVNSVWWVIVFLGVISLALWMYGTFAGFMASPKQRWIVSFISLALVAGTATLVFPVDPPESKVYETDVEGDPVFEEQGFTWKVFSPELMDRLSKEGKVVFLDFTSKQCWTCKANKQAVVYTDAFREAMEKYDVVPVRGDNTNRDPAIEEWLQIYQRAGVPLNVVVPGGAGKTEGILLDTVLTMDQVSSAFKQASEK